MFTRQKLLIEISQFQPMKNSTLIIPQVLLETILDKVYGVTV